MAQRYPIIAREGWLPVAFFTVVGLYAWERWSGAVAVVAWVVAAVLAFYFRDPPRRIPPAPLAVVSPVDGRVLAVEPAYDQRIGRDAVRVHLAMRPLGVFSVRSPIEGKVMQQWFPAADENLFAQWVQSDEHDDVVVVALGRGRGRPASCDRQSGERVGQGQRCGFLSFGGDIEVFLPVTSRLLVQPGDHVQSGVSVLARLVHK
ncbi:MAG: phosphatidylserine decarboxylase [Thiohalomonadaceae bacterium]